MDAVKSFNAELSSLYEVKPPISKAKMTAITRGAIKAIKFYKHVVQSVEKFILKCKPEYKVPGLYVIDSIVRQSRHQFGTDKDVFAPRFAKNMKQTFINLFVCPPEDKSKIIRVLNLWQKNQVFAPEVIQPLFDLADPNNPIYKELGTPLQSNGMNAANAIVKGSPALQKTPTKGSQQGIDGAHLGGTNLNLSDPNVLAHLQSLQRLLQRGGGDQSKSDGPVHFDRKLLDFDYGDEDDEVHSTPKAQSNDVSSLLANPEVLRQLQTLQQSITATGQNSELDIDKLRKLQEMKQQEDEFDKHLAQTVPNLPFAAECEFKPGNNSMIPTGYYLPPGADLSQPPPGYKPPQPFDQPPPPNIVNDVQFNSSKNDTSGDVEIITLDHGDSRSPTPDDRYNRRRRSRSRERSRERRDRDRDRRSRRSRSRSRSKSRRHRSRSRDRNRNKEKETEKDKERKKRGLPAIKKENLSVCSTTLWVGHLSKLVHQEDLSNTFGEFGDIVSIDLIPPRGCAFIVMHRRQDAARCLTKLKNYMLHGKAITLAWAPGKGVKGKDLKDYWEGDLGVSYIPWSKLKPDIDLEMLEDGGMIDEDTMPAWMKAKMASQNNQQNTSANTDAAVVAAAAAAAAATAGFIQVPPPDGTVDTSQPPPVPGAGLLQPPPMLPLVPPFQFNNRLLTPVGMNIPPTMLPPNVPIGVPPPTLPGALMQNQIVGLGSPFQQMPQLPVQPNTSDKNQNQNNNDMKGIADTLMSMAQPFGIMPPAPLSMSSIQQHDDNMDIEMEDVEKPDRSSSEYNRNDDIDSRRDKRGNDRDRRNSRDRDRDRNSFRDRDRSRGSRDDYSRDDRGRDRKDDRRDRPNRWGDRDHDVVIDRRDREKSLNDRLQQMAEGNYPPPHDRLPPRDRNDDMPPNLMDNRRIPPFLPPPKGPPDMDDGFRPEFEPPPPNRPMMDIRDGPMMDDYNPMMDHRGDYHDGPMHGPRMRRDEFDNERFMRGGRRPDFHDNFDHRMRMPPGGPPGPPQGPPDFYPPPRDGFGPRPPMMRGGPDFQPRPPPMMRGPGPHKFHPRGPGPGIRGPRPGRPGFGPRFDHPDFHRGPPGPHGPPGPPGMFDEPPHMRHRGGGGRFEDRRRSRSDYHDNPPSDNERSERSFEKRSRWGGSSPKDDKENRGEQQRHNNNHQNRNNTSSENESDFNSSQITINDDAPKGGNTPLHDEQPLNQSIDEGSEPEEVVTSKDTVSGGGGGCDEVTEEPPIETHEIND